MTLSKDDSCPRALSLALSLALALARALARALALALASWGGDCRRFPRHFTVAGPWRFLACSGCPEL